MEQEKYQVIENEERFFIVDKHAPGFQKKATPNLIESEVKIIRLNAQNCPLKVNCIELEGKPGEEVSSICKYQETEIKHCALTIELRETLARNHTRCLSQPVTKRDVVRSHDRSYDAQRVMDDNLTPLLPAVVV